MSVLKAIRKECLWCCGGQKKEVRICVSTDCYLYPFRLGKKSDSGTSPLQTLKKHCLGCHEPTAQAVRACDFSNQCALWLYRNGRNPNRAGIGNKTGVQFFSKECELSKGKLKIEQTLPWYLIDSMD